MTERELDVIGWGVAAGFGAAYLVEVSAWLVTGGPLLEGVALVAVCALVIRAGFTGARTGMAALRAAGGSTDGE